jgi:hypothetical protein
MNIFFARAGRFNTIDVAINVTVEFFDDDDFSVSTVLDLIKNAVTEWVCSTSEGMQLYLDSSEDINIGDLFCHGIEPLMPYLNKRGIKSIEGFSIENPVSYDKHLVCIASVEDHVYTTETDEEAG